MSGDILTFPENTAPSADAYVATEIATGNRVIKTRTKPEALKVRATGEGVEYSLADWTAAINTVEASAADVAAVASQTANATNVGAAATVTGTLATSIERIGKYFTITFTMTAVRIAVTDGAASGSFGSTKLFDFVQGAASFLGCRQNYTAFVEGAALTGAAGDAAFEIGVGTTAISAAADGTLGNGVNENIGQAVAITLSGGTGTGTAVDGAKTTALDGTGTAITINLNWSGSAATIDANSTIDVTGTITVAGVLLGDD